MKRNYYFGLPTILLVVLFSFCTQNLFAQFDYGTGLISANTAPFTTAGGTNITVLGNSIIVTGNVNMVAGTYNFDNLTINSGDTITVTAGGTASPLVIKCTGVFTNSGVITAAGSNGGAGTVYSVSSPVPEAGGAGGSGGGGWGGKGGAGGIAVDYNATAIGPTNYGQAGVSFGTSNGSGKGGSPYSPNNESAGSGGSYAQVGFPGSDCGAGCGVANTSVGAIYGDAGLVTTMTVGAITTNLLGGSGGGGGGAHCQGSTTAPGLAGGWGGGGGGGAIRVTANSITLNTGSQITVRGGNSLSVNANDGMGGGGSGGTVNLQYAVSSPTVPSTANTDTATYNALIDIAGGAGGNRGHLWYTIGGDGGYGRYLAQQDVSNCTAPTLSAEANGTAPTVYICYGGSVTLTANATGGSGCSNFIEYSWSNGPSYWDGTGFTLPSPVYSQADSTITFIPNLGGSVTYTVTARCNATPSCSSTSSVIVGGFPQPTAPTTATRNPNADSACAGTTVTLAGPASGGTAGLSCSIEYQYSTDGGNNWSTPGTTIPSFAAVAGIGNNIIQARRNNCQQGCAGPTAWNTVATWNGTTVSFSPTVTISTPKTSVCAGNAIVYTAASSNGGSAPVYQWYKNNVAVGGDSAKYVNNAPASYDSVYVFITSNASCASPNTATSNVLKDTILAVARLTVADTICFGASFLGHNSNSTFTDTFTAANGCDSIVTVNLTILPQAASNFTKVICQGQSYDGYNKSGNFVDTLKGASSHGCDSIRTINLTVLAPVVSVTPKTLCQGQSYNGHTTSYIDTLNGAAASGCDSISIVNITVIPTATSTTNQTICQGSSFGGHNTSGTFIDTLHNGAASGCDSISTLVLVVLSVPRDTIYQSVCPGTVFGGHNTTGTFVDTFRASNGCDSIRTLNLTVLSVVHDTVITSLCQGQSYYGHSATGTFNDSFSVGACDSIRTLILTILPNANTDINRVICQGQSVDGHNSTGSYVDTFQSFNGCDSIRTLHLTVNPTLTSVTKQRICEGDSFQHHTIAGTYKDTLSASTGCDSIVTLELEVDSIPAVPTITQSGNTLVTDSGYSQYNWYLDGIVVDSSSNDTYSITQSGNYSVQVINGACSNTSAVDTITYTGIGAVKDAHLLLSVYPNPATDVLNIKLSGLSGNQNVAVKLYDDLGRVILDKTMTSATNNFDLQLNVKDVANGLYLLQVRNGGQNIQQRVVIAK